MDFSLFYSASFPSRFASALSSSIRRLHIPTGTPVSMTRSQLFISSQARANASSLISWNGASVTVSIARMRASW